MSFLIAILILGILVMVHEFGHFITARLTKMPVKEFSIGMGPAIYTYESWTTMYAVRSIPIGGYVNIAGMEIDSTEPDGFNTKGKASRLLVLSAGVLMNFIFAYVALFGYLTINGKLTVRTDATVGYVVETSSAHNVILPDDKILSIEGHTIEKWSDISLTLNNSEVDKDRKLEVLVERGVEEIALEVLPYQESTTKRWMLGVAPKYENIKLPVGERLKESALMCKRMLGQMLGGLWKIVTRQVSKKEVSGPIGIIQFVGVAASQGVSSLIYLAALLSLNLGLFNLLPLPALDGGRILFVLLEVIGIRVNKKLEETIHRIGMVALFVAICFVSFNDVARLFGR